MRPTWATMGKDPTWNAKKWLKPGGEARKMYLNFNYLKVWTYVWKKNLNVPFLIPPSFLPAQQNPVLFLTSNRTRSGQVKRISSSWLTSWQWRWLVLKDRRIAWFDGILDPKWWISCESKGPTPNAKFTLIRGMIKGQWCLIRPYFQGGVELGGWSP